MNLHVREPLYSNSAVIAGWFQSPKAHNILFWFTVIHSMIKLVAIINFHDDFFFIWNYYLGIIVYSRSTGVFKFKTLAKYQPISGQLVGFNLSQICSQHNECAIKVISYDLMASHNEEYDLVKE